MLSEAKHLVSTRSVPRPRCFGRDAPSAWHIHAGRPYALGERQGTTP